MTRFGFNLQITRKEHNVIVISPLIALMTDQQRYLRSHGIQACMLRESGTMMSDEDRDGNVNKIHPYTLKMKQNRYRYRSQNGNTDSV